MDRAEMLISNGLDQLSEGFGIFDDTLRLISCNRLFRELRNYPEPLCAPGTSLQAMIRFNAERGDFGPGSVDLQVAERMAEIKDLHKREIEREMANGQILKIRYRHLEAGGLTVTFEDITGEYSAKAALEASEQRYALLSQAAEQAIYEWDIAAGEFYSSPGLSDILRMEFSQGNGRDWSWEAQIHPDDLAHYQQSLADHLSGKQHKWDCEYRFGVEGGEYRWISDRGMSVRGHDGAALKMVAAVTDITEKMTQNAALRASEERYALVARATSDGLYDWDLGSDELYVSDRLNELFAFDGKGVTSRHWANRVHLDDLPHYIETIRRHFKGQSDYLECEYRIVGKDGNYHWVRDHGIGVRDENGRAIRLVGAVRDITDVRAAEAQLEAAHVRFSDAIEALSSGFALFDADDRMVVCNAKYREYFPKLQDVVSPGTSITEILRAAMERGLFPESAEDPDIWLAEVLEKRAATRGIREQHLDGELWLQISDHRTKEGGIVSIYTDITELKLRQAETLKAMQQAEQAQRETEEANRKALEQNKILATVSDQLAKYISPQLYQSIFSGQQEVKIASKRKKLTIFFSDIANFTEITDQLESEELTGLLNQYLTEMSRIAQKFGAYFDKFIGDAMIFYFGDPESKGVKGDAAACVRMAITMQRRLRNLQVEWQEQGLMDRPFETRIGINTGYCTVGNFGSEDRMDYTIIGGEVNLTARLEANADAGGILMASETYSLVKDWLLAEEQEAITMKGFAKPVRTYRVTGIYDELAAEGRVVHSDINGLSLMLNLDQLDQKDKQDAIQKLNEALAQITE